MSTRTTTCPIRAPASGLGTRSTEFIKGRPKTVSTSGMATTRGGGRSMVMPLPPRVSRRGPGRGDPADFPGEPKSRPPRKRPLDCAASRSDSPAGSESRRRGTRRLVWQLDVAHGAAGQGLRCPHRQAQSVLPAAIQTSGANSGSPRAAGKRCRPCAEEACSEKELTERTLFRCGKSLNK